MPLRVAVTHDVDRERKTYHYFTKTLKAILKGDLKQFTYHVKSIFARNNPYWTFDDLVAILNTYEIKSTFFFLNETMRFKLFEISNWSLSLGRYNIESDKIKNKIRELKMLGHEIGVHGSFNSYRDYDLLTKEKRVLEKIIGGKIIGIRQHHLNLDDNTWILQKKAGFVYDASWGWNFSIGVRDGKAMPFRPFDDSFLVIPMTIMDAPFVAAADKWEQFDKLIKFAEENGSVIVLNWHTDSLNDNEFENYRSDFIKILDLLKSKNASFYRLSEIYHQFTT